MKFQVVKVSDYGDYNPEPPCSGAKSEFVKVLSEIYVDGNLPTISSAVGNVPT